MDDERRDLYDGYGHEDRQHENDDAYTVFTRFIAVIGPAWTIVIVLVLANLVVTGWTTYLAHVVARFTH